MAFRKEQIGDCTLYLGDCMDILPTLGKVDAVVTDVPYGTEDIVGGYRRGGTVTIANDKDFTVSEACLKYLQSNLENVWIISFFSGKRPKEIIACLNDIYEIAVWDKCQMGLGGDFRSQTELIALARVGKPESLNKGSTIFKFTRDASEHPHQKPIRLMETLIGLVNGIVLDPFMGSGTTLVACAKMGRKGIGIELDPDYFEIACRRVEQAYAQPDLFIEPPAKQVQHGLDL